MKIFNIRPNSGIPSLRLSPSRPSFPWVHICVLHIFVSFVGGGGRRMGCCPERRGAQGNWGPPISTQGQNLVRFKKKGSPSIPDNPPDPLNPICSPKMIVAQNPRLQVPAFPGKKYLTKYLLISFLAQLSPLAILADSMKNQQHEYGLRFRAGSCQLSQIFRPSFPVPTRSCFLR